MPRNPFEDQRRFMVACNQNVGTFDQDQFDMYIGLLEEELNELSDAIEVHDTVETLDALLDVMVVTIGALQSFGVDVGGAWNEVVRSNMSKVDLATGRVLKREDGKVLKPETYSPPDLAPFIYEHDRNLG